jgi:integrase
VVRGATWDEVDLAHAIWTIPGSRTKAGRNSVPLSAPAIALLQSVALLRAEGSLVFPSPQKRRQPMIDRALTYPLERMGRGDLTAHGFRSTFRDWAAEATGRPNHVVEQALAHTIGSAVEAAYRRGDLFAKRVVLINHWASYLEQPLAKVVHLPRSAAHGHSGEPTAPRRPGGTASPKLQAPRSALPASCA